MEVLIEARTVAPTESYVLYCTSDLKGRSRYPLTVALFPYLFARRSNQLFFTCEALVLSKPLQKENMRGTEGV